MLFGQNRKRISVTQKLLHRLLLANNGDKNLERALSLLSFLGCDKANITLVSAGMDTDMNAAIELRYVLTFNTLSNVDLKRKDNPCFKTKLNRFTVE